MDFTYYLCDKCEHIAYRRVNNTPETLQCTKCGTTIHAIRDDKLSELDTELKPYGITITWFSGGRVVFDNEKYHATYPILKYHDSHIDSYFTNILLNSIDASKYSITTETKDRFGISACVEYIGAKIDLDNSNNIKMCIKILDIRNHFYDTIIRAIKLLKVSTISTPRGKAYTGDLVIRDTKKVYWCEECGNIGHISIANRPILAAEIEFDSSIEITDPIVKYEVSCKKCDSYMVELDCDIADRIKKLNDMGIMTMYCCQGHYRKSYQLPFPKTLNGYSTTNYVEHPYIQFMINDYTVSLVEGIIEELNKSGRYDDIGIEKYTNEGFVFIIRVDIPDIDEDIFNSRYNQFMQFIDEFIEMYKVSSN